MSIATPMKSASETFGFCCCGWLAVLFALLAIVVVVCKNWPAFRTHFKSCVVPFVCRFLLLLAIGAALLLCLAFAIQKFDSLDVVLRATSYFAPYSSSVPFILILLALALVCCIPGGPTALLQLSKRIKAIGPLELFPDKDPDIDHKQLIVEAEKEINIPSDASGKTKAQAVVKLVAEKLNRFKQKKEFLLQQHAGRIFATITKTSIHTSLCPQFFDACLTQNDKQVFVRILSVEASRPMAQLEGIEVFCDLVPASLQRQVLVNIVLYAEAVKGEDSPFTRYQQAITEVEDRIRHRTNIRLFRYSVTQNNAVKPEE